MCNTQRHTIDAVRKGASLLERKSETANESDDISIVKCNENSERKNK